MTPYLKELVTRGHLRPEVADILGRLPTLEQQQEALKSLRSEIEDMAEHIVVRMERKNKGDNPFPHFEMEGKYISIARPFYYLQETLNEYLEMIADDFQSFFEKQTCDVCHRSMSSDARHRDCAYLTDMQLPLLLLEGHVKAGSATDWQVVALQQLREKIKDERRAMERGQRIDGAEWNSPWPEEIQNAPGPGVLSVFCQIAIDGKPANEI